MSEPLYYEQLRPGNVWKSRGRTITDADVVNFAGLTGDFDPLHVDHEFASSTPFGRPIAHGLLGLSFLAGLSSNAPAVHTEAFVAIRNWEFKRPLYPGDTVHVETEVVRASESGRRRGRILWQRRLVNQDGEIVQIGSFETLVSREKVSVSPAPRAELLRSGVKQGRSA